MEPEVLTGNLLEQQVDVIVNPWNRNVIPWWLLLPQGVSGALKRRAGTQPFRELARLGPIPLGGAVLTGAGRLPYRGIIHVAGIDLLWRASEKSITGSVTAAMRLVIEHSFASVAFPLIGAGIGSVGPERALGLMIGTLRTVDYAGRIVIVRFSGPRGSR